MQHDNYELLIQLPKKMFYSESEENKYPSSTPFSEIFSSSSQPSPSLKDLTITSAELRDLQLHVCFSLVVCLNLSMLHFFIAVHWDKSFPTATLFHNFQNIFQKFDIKLATEIDFNTFQFGKHSFQFSVRNWNCK